MEEKRHPFSKLIDGIVNPEKHHEDLRRCAGEPSFESQALEMLLANAKEAVLNEAHYRGGPFEGFAYELLKQALAENNPTIRVQFVAQVLWLAVSMADRRAREKNQADPERG